MDNNSAIVRRWYANILTLLAFLNPFMDLTKGWSVHRFHRRSSTTPRWASAVLDDEMPSLYKEQEKLLINRGEIEGKLMANTFKPLETNVVKGAGSGGGFGAKSGAGTAQLKTQAKAHAKTFRNEGVVRIDGVLSDKNADALRSYLYEMRQESEDLVREGKIRPIDRFADVLLKKNRCDMPVPLGTELVAEALNEVLVKSSIGNLVKSVLGDKAVLYELSCLMSDPGSQRQVVHPDNPYIEGQTDPTLCTCFIALQDITLEMGPTTWIPRTHTKEMHEQFQDESESSSSEEESGKDRLLRTQPSVIGILPKGSCGFYDSRLLHCGGANQSDQSRALFYFSFKNPKIGYPGNPGSIRKELASQSLTLKDITDDLKKYSKGKATQHLL